jgi:diacylglycerol kinase family enzyme
MIAIVNPAAAGGRLGNTWPRLRRRLQAAGFDPPLAFTEAPGHATALAADAVRRGETLVVAAGGGFPLTPAAVPDDGALDACLVEGTGVPARLSRLVAGVRGTLAHKPGSHELRFTRLDLETDVPVPCHFDGNPSSIEPPGMTFSVLPRAQTVITSATGG